MNCLAIAARAAEAETLNRHWVYYCATGIPIIGVTPSDEPASFKEGVPVIYAGKAGHHGPDAIARLQNAYRALLQTPYMNFALLEYDCVIFREDIVFPVEGIMSNIMFSNDPAFQEKKFPHGMWTMSRHTMSMLLRTMEEHPEVAESGMGDRYIAVIARLAGVPLLHEPKSYSRNSLDKPEFIVQAREALKNGAKWIHGIKTKEQLDAVLS